MTKTTIEERSELEAFLANPARDWSNAILLGLDLGSGPDEHALMGETPKGAVLIGCIAQAALVAHFVSHGALVVSRSPDSIGFSPFQTQLYNAGTLLGGFDPADPDASYRRTYDWTAYLVSMDPRTKLPLAPA